MDVELRRRRIGGEIFPAVSYPNQHRWLRVPVTGRIANANPTGNRESERERQRELKRQWQVRVASAAKERRGHDPWNDQDFYAISIAFRFHPENHGNRDDLDVDNYIKPILDALAAGLFCAPRVDPATLTSWHFEDTNFRSLFAYRLPNPPARAGEGVAIYVSARRGP